MAPTVAELLVDARCTLGKEAQIFYSPPPAFQSALAQFRAAHPTEKFRVVLHGGVGYGTACCLSCRVTLNLDANSSLRDGGESDGFGTLEVFRVHLASEAHLVILHGVAHPSPVQQNVEPNLMDVDAPDRAINTDHIQPNPSLPQIKPDTLSHQLASALLSALPRDRKPQLYNLRVNVSPSPTASSSEKPRFSSNRSSPPSVTKPATFSKPPPAARALSSIAISDAEDADGEMGDLSADDRLATAPMDKKSNNQTPVARPRKAKAVVFDSDDDALPPLKTPRKPVLAKTSSPARSSPAKRQASAMLVLSDDDSDAAPAGPSAKALGKRRAVAPVSSDSDIQFVDPLPTPLERKVRPSSPRPPSPEPDPALQIALLDIQIRKHAAAKTTNLTAAITEKIRLRKEAGRLGVDWTGLYEPLFPKKKAATPTGTPNRFEREREEQREASASAEDVDAAPKDKPRRKEKNKEREKRAREEAAAAKRAAIAKPNVTAIEAARNRVTKKRQDDARKKLVNRDPDLPVPAPSQAPAQNQAANIIAQLAGVDPYGNPPPMPGMDREVVYPDEVEFAASIEEIEEFNRLNRNHDHDKSATVNEAMVKLGLTTQDEKIPGMRISLLPFQIISVSWMNEREQAKKAPGGILADDMGLGKTIQAITLMVLRQSDDAVIRTNLVIVPLSLLVQWEDEIKRRCIGLTTLIYHGKNKRGKTAEDFINYDVVITTHGTVMGQLPKKGSEAKPGILFDLCWWRVVIDEAHIIRNRLTRISRACAKLDAVYRWCLTGTPVVNSLADLFPLMRFLRWKPWSDWKHYNTEIVKLERKTESALQATDTADAAMAPITMRRRKTDMLEGKPLIKLKSKDVLIRELDFDPSEREAYDAAEREAQIEIKKYLRRGTLFKNMSHILTLILRLRQLCIHPLLIAENGADDAIDYASELARAEKLLGGAVVQRLLDDRLAVALERARADQAGVVEDEDMEGDCAICLEWVESTTGIVTSCGHRFCRECIAEVFMEAQAENLDDEGQRMKKDERPCPNCRAPISVDKFFDLDTFEPSEEQIEAALGPKAGAAPPDDHAREKADRIVLDSDSDDAPPPPEKKSVEVVTLESDSDEDLPTFDQLVRDIKPKVDVKPKLPATFPPKKKSGPKPKGKDLGKGKELVPAAPPKKAAPRKVDFTSAIPSTKMKEIYKLLHDSYAQNRKIKTIVISSFTSALDILDQFLTFRGIATVRYQGSCNQEERKEAIDTLKDDPHVRVMLMSLKAGGVGLNLTSACRVITLDCAWSEAVENQAIDRVYRLGQAEDVVVNRLTAKDTIEERILMLQKRKAFYSDGALHEGQFKSGVPRHTLSVPELLGLFRLGPNGEKLQKSVVGGRPVSPRGSFA